MRASIPHLSSQVWSMLRPSGN